MSDEGNLWRRMRAGLDSVFLLTRVENVVADGMPDVYWARRGGGGDGWAELKHAHGWPAKPGTKVLGAKGMRPAQKAWCHAHAKAGVRVWIVVAVGRSTFLVHGRHAREVNEWTQAEFWEHATLSFVGAVRWEVLAETMAAFTSD